MSHVNHSDGEKSAAGSHTQNMDPSDLISSNPDFSSQGPECVRFLAFLAGKPLPFLKYLVTLNKSPGWRHIIEDHTDLSFSPSSTAPWCVTLGKFLHPSKPHFPDL